MRSDVYPNNHGISVVIPTYNRSQGLQSALNSLAKQTLDKTLFEVVIVSNGSSTVDFEALASQFPELDLRLAHSVRRGAGRARNIGIRIACRSFITFLDDDDRLEDRYLENALKFADPNTVVLMPIVNEVNGEFQIDNSLNARIAPLAGKLVDLHAVPWILGFNACKVFSTEIARKMNFDESLKSGEDVAFFAHLLSEKGLKALVPLDTDRAAYIRTVSENSVSRQSTSWEFNVRQRLEVIRDLQGIQLSGVELQARESLEQAQFSFVTRFLEQADSRLEESIDFAAQLSLTGLDWEPLRKQRAKKVVFSYCFPPFADTSANVIAKLIYEQEEYVDVFYADMSAVRGVDRTTTRLVAKYVIHSEEIPSVPSFSDWRMITDYAERAAQRASKRHSKVSEYSSMYSRAMWSGSHVAALLFKHRHPEVEWEAEFSDPMTLGVTGEKREGAIQSSMVTRRLKKMLRNSSWRGINYSTHFELTEVLTLIYADRIVFTNENQKREILRAYPEEFAELINGKSLIRNQVVPSPDMYRMVKSKYPLESGTINIAYFGSYYPNRGLGEVLEQYSLLTPELRGIIQFHVFTSSANVASDEVRRLSLDQNVKVNPTVEYLEFLNLCKHFDVLLVNDTDTRGSFFKVNPFLPSKYSDYVGSGSAVWSLAEPESILSKMPSSFSSLIGDPESIRNALISIIQTSRLKPGSVTN